MFTVDDISIRCVERNTFSRGELIYKVGNVKHFHTEPIILRILMRKQLLMRLQAA